MGLSFTDFVSQVVEQYSDKIINLDGREGNIESEQIIKEIEGVLMGKDSVTPEEVPYGVSSLAFTSFLVLYSLKNRGFLKCRFVF